MGPLSRNRSCLTQHITRTLTIKNTNYQSTRIVVFTTVPVNQNSTVTFTSSSVRLVGTGSAANHTIYKHFHVLSHSTFTVSAIIIVFCVWHLEKGEEKEKQKRQAEQHYHTLTPKVGVISVTVGTCPSWPPPLPARLRDEVLSPPRCCGQLLCSLATHRRQLGLDPRVTKMSARPFGEAILLLTPGFVFWRGTRVP